MAEGTLSTHLNRRIGITSFDLKIIASVAMFLDHFGYVVVAALIGLGYPLLPLYRVLRFVGRAAMPIYCFLVAYGFTKTRNPRGYAMRLACFALISEIPFNLMMNGSWLDVEHQNVMFTLLLGLLSAMIVRFLSEHHIIWLGLLSTALIGAAAICLKTDYRIGGVVCVTAMYLIMILPFEKLRHPNLLRVIAITAAVFALAVRPAVLLKGNFASCVSTFELPAIMAVLPICFFNGEKGKRLENEHAKYAFYAFYPLHILFLVCVNLIIKGAVT